MARRRPAPAPDLAAEGWARGYARSLWLHGMVRHGLELPPWHGTYGRPDGLDALPGSEALALVVEHWTAAGLALRPAPHPAPGPA